MSQGRRSYGGLGSINGDPDIESGSINSTNSTGSESETIPLLILDHLRPEEQEVRSHLYELFGCSPKLSSAIEELAKGVGTSTIIFLESMMPLAIWAILENNFAGFPSSFRQHMDKLDNAMPAALIATCFLKAAYVLKTDEKKALNATIVGLNHIVDAITVACSTAQLAQDTIISIYLQFINPNAGSVSGSGLNDFFFFGALLPGAVLGTAHSLMEFSEGMSTLAEKYGITLPNPLKKVLPEKVFSLLATAYPGIRSAIRGLCVTGGTLNGWANTIIVLKDIDLADYPAIDRTMLYVAPHVAGLAIEILLKKYGSEKTLKYFNHGILLATGLMYLALFLDDFIKKWHDEDRRLSDRESWLPIVAFSFITFMSLTAPAFMRMWRKSTEEQVRGLIDMMRENPEAANELLRDSAPSNTTLSSRSPNLINDNDQSSEDLERSPEATSPSASESGSFNSDDSSEYSSGEESEYTNQSQEAISRSSSESGSFNSDDYSEHLSDEEREYISQSQEAVSPSASESGSFNSDDLTEHPNEEREQSLLVRQTEARDLIRGLGRTLFAPVSEQTNAPQQAARGEASPSPVNSPR